MSMGGEGLVDEEVKGIRRVKADQGRRDVYDRYVPRVVLGSLQFSNGKLGYPM